MSRFCRAVTPEHERIVSSFAKKPVNAPPPTILVDLRKVGAAARPLHRRVPAAVVATAAMGLGSS
jgi:hypothetical protein